MRRRTAPLWPGGPRARTRMADGRPAMPPGWQPPAPEDQARIMRLIRQRRRHGSRRA